MSPVAHQSIERLRETLFGLEHGLRRIARHQEEARFDATAQHVAHALLFVHELRGRLLQRLDVVLDLARARARAPPPAASAASTITSARRPAPARATRDRSPGPMQRSELRQLAARAGEHGIETQHAAAAHDEAGHAEHRDLLEPGKRHRREHQVTDQRRREAEQDRRSHVRHGRRRRPVRGIAEAVGEEVDRVVDDAADEARSEYQREDVHFAEHEVHDGERRGDGQRQSHDAEQQRAHRAEYQQQQQHHGDRFDRAEGRHFMLGALGRGARVLDGARADDLHRRLRRLARREPRARDGGNHALLRRGGKRMALVFGEHQHELAAVTLRDQHRAFQARIARDRRAGAQEIVRESERILGQAQRLHEPGGRVGGAQRALHELLGRARLERLPVAPATAGNARCAR